MYGDIEVKLSLKHLTEIIASLQKPFCLIGGWAVYFTVNENFKNATGRDYFGSKDIDLGFPIKKDWNEEDIKESNLAKAVNKLEKMGFERVGWSLRKYYCVSKKQFVSIKEQKKIPFYDLVMLQVDSIVERNPAKVKKALNCFFFGEELLSQVFEENKQIEIKIEKQKLMIPMPEILIATKIKSIPNRTKGHKKQKDLYDLYALIQFSPQPAEELIKKAKEIVPQKSIKKTIDSITKEEQETIEKELGTPIERQKQINTLLLED